MEKAWTLNLCVNKKMPPKHSVTAGGNQGKSPWGLTYFVEAVYLALMNSEQVCGLSGWRTPALSFPCLICGGGKSLENKDLCGSKQTETWTAWERSPEPGVVSEQACAGHKGRARENGTWGQCNMFLCSLHTLLQPHSPYGAPVDWHMPPLHTPHCGPGLEQNIGKSCQARRNHAERNTHSDHTSVLP